MLQPPYQAAEIGRTGRGNSDHKLDQAFAEEPKLQVIAVADSGAITYHHSSMPTALPRGRLLEKNGPEERLGIDEPADVRVYYWNLE